jgi:hypothetical protein
MVSLVQVVAVQAVVAVPQDMRGTEVMLELIAQVLRVMVVVVVALQILGLLAAAVELV